MASASTTVDSNPNVPNTGMYNSINGQNGGATAPQGSGYVFNNGGSSWTMASTNPLQPSQNSPSNISQPQIPVTSLNTQAANVPAYTPPAAVGNAQSVISNVGALNGNNGQNITPSQNALLNTTQGNVNANTDQYNAKGADISALIDQYAGMGADQAAQEQAAGVPGLQTQSNALTQQYNAMQATYNQQYNDILNRVGGTSEEKAQEIDALQQQHGYNLTNVGIQQSIAQNDYNNAETLIQHQITLKYSGLANQISYQQQFLANDKDLLSQSESQNATANLQVQQQMFTQSTYAAQLNGDASMAVLKAATANGAPADTITKIGQLIASGASTGDVAAAAGQYGANGNYSIAFNPATGNLEPFNANTGQFKSGATVPSNSPIINSTDPSSASTITTSTGQYNLSTYATDPSYGLKINQNMAQVQNAVGNVTDAKSAQAAISILAPNSPITGQQIMTAATSAGVDPTLLLAQIKQESLCGVSTVATNNNNCGGITWTGSAAQIAAGMTQGGARPASEGGNYAKFKTMQDGLNYQAQILANSKVPPTSITPGQTPTIQSKIQSVLATKTALPSNISGAVNYVNSTGDGYIDLSKVQDLPGYPAGYANNQALAYAKQLGLATLDSGQVQDVQAYDKSMAVLNNVENDWKGVAPDGLANKIGAAEVNPTAGLWDANFGTQLKQYSSNTLAALSTLKGIVGTARPGTFSVDLGENALPQLPVNNAIPSPWNIASFVPTLGLLGVSGDTLTDGLAKIDNLKASLNASLQSIDPSHFTGAPLSNQTPQTPVPKAGSTVTKNGVTIKINADGSSDIVQ